MKVSLLAFGIARDILGSRTMSIELEHGADIKALKRILMEGYRDMSRLASLSFAVNEEYVKDDYELSEGEEIVIIPPVSGG